MHFSCRTSRGWLGWGSTRGVVVIKENWNSFFKWANPGIFLFIFGLFKQTSIQFLQQIYVEKCPSSIWCRGSNSRPLERESLLITTRPGLPGWHPKVWQVRACITHLQQLSLRFCKWRVEKVWNFILFCLSCVIQICPDKSWNYNTVPKIKFEVL